jgi:hypothetical protein
MIEWIRRLFFSPTRFCEKYGHAWEEIHSHLLRCQTCGKERQM